MLALLRQRNFALLWSAKLVSAIGDWFLQIALPLHVYTLTGSSLATSVSFLVYNVPRILFSVLTGSLIDRWDRRHILFSANLLCALALLPLLLVNTPGRMWALYIVIFVQACIVQLITPTVEAYVPLVVDQSALLLANSLNASTYGVARLLGAAAGGVLLDILGFNATVLVDVLSFTLAAGLFYSIRVSARATILARDAATPFRAALHAGLRVIWRSRGLRSLLYLDALSNVSYGLITVLLVVFVRDILHGAGTTLGMLATAQGCGFIIGTYIIGRIKQRWTAGRILIASLLAMGGSYLVAFSGSHAVAAVPGLVIAGVAVTGAAVAERTLLQTGVPSKYLGRVFSVFAAYRSTFNLVGIGLASLLPNAIGLRAVLVFSSVLYFGAGLIAMSTNDPNWSVEAEETVNA